MKLTFSKSLVAAVIGSVVSITAIAQDATGAGATFPAPIYAKWAEGYKAATGKAINYQSMGSSGGIKQIKAKTVDFGATDAPLSGNEVAKGGMVQFPAVMGGVVVIYNLKGIASGALKLDGAVLADIFVGNITKWNDAKIAALNPGVKLPHVALPWHTAQTAQAPRRCLPSTWVWCLQTSKKKWVRARPLSG